MLFDGSEQLFRAIKADTIRLEYTQYLGEYYD